METKRFGFWLRSTDGYRFGSAMRFYLSTLVAFAFVITIPFKVRADSESGIGHLSIKGGTYLQLSTPQGTSVYTSDTPTRVRKLSRLWSGTHGYVLQPSIAIPQDATRFRLSRQGIASFHVWGSAAAVVLGQLSAVRFEHPEALESIGNGLFQESVQSGPPVVGIFSDDGFGSIVYKKKR